MFLRYTVLALVLPCCANPELSKSCDELYSDLFGEMGTPSQSSCAADGDCVLYFAQVPCYTAGCGDALTTASATAYAAQLAHNTKIPPICDALIHSNCQPPVGACSPAQASCVNARCVMVEDS